MCHCMFKFLCGDGWLGIIATAPKSSKQNGEKGTKQINREKMVKKKKRQRQLEVE